VLQVGVLALDLAQLQVQVALLRVPPLLVLHLLSLGLWLVRKVRLLVLLPPLLVELRLGLFLLLVWHQHLLLAVLILHWLLVLLLGLL
jgi:hypothetical protein